MSVHFINCGGVCPRSPILFQCDCKIYTLIVAITLISLRKLIKIYQCNKPAAQAASDSDPTGEKVPSGQGKHSSYPGGL